MHSWTKLWALLVALCALLVPALALAQKPATLHVVALDSDDASEDQADALTAALRARVRASPSFQLVESNQSLSTLLPALKCPARPDSACLQRIGDQLKTDRFIWGYVQKASMPHQVSAEVHLWTRGKPEQVAKETYSDNLKDQNDDALRRIAAQLYEHLTGQATQGTLVVKANAQTGTVLVDGKPMGQLDHGQTSILISSGSHTVEIQSEGMSAPSQSVNVAVNASSEVSFDLKAAAVGPAPAPSGPSHTKRTIGFVALGVAGAAAIGAGILGGMYFSNQSTWNDYASGVDVGFKQICTANQGPPSVGTVSHGDACSARSTANTVWPIAWGLAGGAVAFAVVGVVLVMTDHGKEEGPPPPASGSLRVLPTFGPDGAGVTALLTF